MKSVIAVSSLFAVGLLSACGQNFQSLGTASATSSQQSSSAAQSNSVSDKILQDVATDLRQKSLLSSSGLSETQIQTLIQTATAGLQSSGLASATNLQTLLPGLVGQLTQSLGKLPLGHSNQQIADLLSTIEQSVIGSAGTLPSSLTKADLMSLISKSLFQNLPAAGISTGNLSGVAGTVMNTLIAQLGQQGLSQASLATLVQSLTSGATLGVGNLHAWNLTGTQIAGILQQIGVGSTQGLSTLPAAIANGDVLQTLINSVVNGATQGLNQSSGVKAGLNVGQLLSSLIAGQATGLSNSGLSSAQQKPASLLLQLLLSRL
jgi:hypothetical protein